MSEPGTPLPWKWVHTKTKRGLQLPLRISDETDGKWVAHACNVYDDGHLDYIDVGEQDAAYIVEACNAYPHLVVALRNLLDAAKDIDYCLTEYRNHGPHEYAWQCCGGGFPEPGHKDDCDYAAAIAEAERLLQESEAKDE